MTPIQSYLQLLLPAFSGPAEVSIPPKELENAKSVGVGYQT